MARLIVALLTAVLAACSSNYADTPNSTTSPFVARYDPKAGVIPFPNDILHDPQTGHLTLPLANPAAFNPADPYADPAAAANTLFGFSTTAPITISFSSAVDPQSLADPYAWAVFELATTNGVPTSIVARRAQGKDIYAFVSPNDPATLVIKPLVPLKPLTTYLVVVSDRLKALDGRPAVPDLTFRYLKQTAPLVDPYGHSLIPAPDADARRLESLRRLLVGAVKPLLQTQGFAWGGPDNGVAAAWTFTTQPVTGLLYALARQPVMTAQDVAPPSANNPLGVLDIYSAVLAFDPYGTKGLRDLYAAGALASVASVAIGTVNLPYYLAAANHAKDTAPLVQSFQLDAYGMPVVRSRQHVPFLLIYPNTRPGPWPVVIFQHGFMRSKEDVFAIAGALAKAGFATIAMDAPLHGDRTFGLDLVTEDAYGNLIAQGPDGKPDSSGRHFLNLGHLLVSRDNVREAVADLIHLEQALRAAAANIDLVSNVNPYGKPGADGQADLYTAFIGYVGHSLGGMLGAILAGVDPYIAAYALANPGGNYADILTLSPTFKPQIDAGLQQQAGIQPGSADYWKFFTIAQTIMDDADPLNYGQAAVLNGKPVFLLRTQGDAVVPNATTDALARALELVQVVYDPQGQNDPYAQHAWPLGTANSPAANNGFANYMYGDHSTFLKPPAAPVGMDTLIAMQATTAYFLATAAQGMSMIDLGIAATQGALRYNTPLVQIVE